MSLGEGHLVLIFGPPGSGKSTQGQLLASAMGWNWASTGQILKQFGDRDMIERLGRGELATDEEVNPFVDKAVEEKTAGGQTLIIDGYPRNLTQAERMIGVMPPISVAISLTVPDEEVIARINARDRDAGDGTVATRRRIDIFKQNINNVERVFKQANVPWVEINGVASVEEIHAKIMAEIKNVYNL